MGLKQSINQVSHKNSPCKTLLIMGLKLRMLKSVCNNQV